MCRAGGFAKALREVVVGLAVGFWVLEDRECLGVMAGLTQWLMG